jgi:hypothetical protein
LSVGRVPIAVRNLSDVGEDLARRGDRGSVREDDADAVRVQVVDLLGQVIGELLDLAEGGYRF